MSLLLYVWKNRYLRYPVLLLIGGFIYLASMGARDEAANYKDGPQSVDVETLGAENLEYDYVKLTGLSDSYYIYSYFSEGKDEEKADTDKAIILYYALHTLEEFDTSIAGEQSHPAVVVRQILPQEQRACVETEEGCLTGGEMTLEGRVSKEMTYESDKEALDKLAADGLYTFDDNTLYFEEGWKPATASSASELRGVGLGWIGVTVAGLFYSMFKRRKKNAPDEAITRDPNLITSQEQ
jgi:hypothetical protein